MIGKNRSPGASRSPGSKEGAVGKSRASGGSGSCVTLSLACVAVLLLCELSCLLMLIFGGFLGDFTSVFDAISSWAIFQHFCLIFRILSFKASKKV